MKVNQLITELTRPNTRLQADERLRQAGYSRLARGDFGAVYERPGANFVLKVFANSDAAYLAFLELARAHSDNPHFPKFFGKLVRITPVYSAIRMEKLAPYRGNPSAIDVYLRLSNYYREHPNGPSGEMGDAMEFMEYHPELKAACDLIADNLRPQYQLDIKQSNLMVRGSTIVLIDPVAEPSAPTEKLPYVEPLEEPKPQVSRTPAQKAKWDAIMDDELLRQLRH
jgi:hypothetical protein